MYSKKIDLIGDSPDYAAKGAFLVVPADDLELGQQAWRRIKARLRAELGEDVFSSWFARMELAEAQDGVASLSVPTKFLKSWVSAHYRDRIMRLFKEAECGIEDVQLVVRTAGQKLSPPRAAAADRQPGVVENLRKATESARQETAPAAAADAPSSGLSGSPLDRRYTFASFLVGQSNAFAHAAAQQVSRAQTGDKPIYNPLYLHAAVGLGKTHLCQALAQELEGSGRRIVYLTAEKFMYGFVAALKAQSAIAFKEKLRAIDVLVIDDVSSSPGNPSSRSSATR
jgi:chromosomal replication initiator protein